MSGKGEEEEEEKRCSKDKKVNAEERILLERLEELGWVIWNGDMRRNEEREWTYTGARGDSVIDYVIGEARLKVYAERLEIGDRIDSDHHPVVTWLSTKRDRRRERKERKVKREVRKKMIWSEERGRRSD